MKSFRKFVAEVAQPKPEEEKRFKDQHEYEVVAHPVAEPHQHTGEIQKPKAKRLADQEGEANYDKAVKNPEKRMAAESVEEEQLDEISKELAQRYYTKASKSQSDSMSRMIKNKKDSDAKKTFNKRHAGLDNAAKRLAKEEVEQVDEISKDLAGRYIKKAQVDSADAGMDTASQDRDIRQRGIKKFLKRRKGVDSAVKRLMKPEELSPKQKKLDHNKNGKIDGHDLAMLRAKKKNEEVELDETTTSAIKKPVTMTGPDGKTRTVMKKAKADQTDDRGQDKIATNESVEMIDEAIKFKKGPIRLKDGSQIMVSKEDADLLNQMFKDLSARNQREMEKVAMTDKAGFEEIRGFAREAL